MQSQLTVRLSDQLNRKISGLAKRLSLKRSDVVRMALESFVQDFQGEEQGRPYDKIRDLIGSVSSGIPDLGEAHRRHVLKRIRKHA